MPDQDPSPFLKADKDPLKPAKVNQAEDPWKTVLKSSGLEIQDESSTSVGSNAAVSATSSQFWKLKFASVHNADYFKPSAGVVSANRMHNDAWVGDDLGSAVLLLTTPDDASMMTMNVGEVLKTFGISLDSTSLPKAMASFLNKVLSRSGLRLKLALIDAPPENPNALWCFTTTSTYQTIVQLSFTLDPATDKDDGPMAQAIGWANELLGLNISLKDIRDKLDKIPDILITLRKTTTFTSQNGTLTSSNSNSMSFEFSIIGFRCAIDLDIATTSVLLQPATTAADIYSSLKAALNPPDDAGLDSGDMPSDTDDIFTEFFNHVNLWYVRLEKSTTLDMDSLSWGVGIIITWTIGSSKTPIAIALSYDSAISVFKGSLLLSTTLSSDSTIRQPGYDHRAALPAKSGDVLLATLPPSISIFELAGISSSPPKVLPVFVTDAEVSYQTFADGAAFAFSAVLSNSPSKKPDADEVPSGFVWNTVAVSTHITKFKASELKPTEARSRTRLSCMTAMTLNPVHDQSLKPATLSVILSYDTARGGNWLLNGSISNVTVAHIAECFDTDCSEGAMAVIGKLGLSNLDVFYAYNSSGKASSFLITAILKIGELELDLSYQYVSTTLHDPKTPTAAQQKWGDSPPKEVNVLTDTKKTAWVFEAFLKVGSPSSTIGTVVESIRPGTINELPEFVRNISLVPQGSVDNSPVKLRYSGDNNSGSTLILYIGIGVFSLTFVQLRTAPTDSKKATLKRLIRVSVDQIPYLDRVPLVNQLPQPFDHLLYFWVQDDDDSEQDATKKGFTRGNINDNQSDNAVNTMLTDMKIPPIMMKDVKKEDKAVMELRTGHHFQIVAHGKIVLDHVFQDAKTKKDKAATTTNNSTGTMALANDTSKSLDAKSAPDEAPPTRGSTNTKAGALTISGLSLQFKHGSLFIGLDATLALGPMEFGVKGFTIEIEMGKVKLDSLADIVKKELIHIHINGLAAGLSKPPLTLKGVFAHVEGAGEEEGSTFDSYQGGIAVGFKAWNILAVGEYRVTTRSDKSQYKSVFVYGKLDGPLVTIEFATISGVRLGFGYNSMVKLPMAEKLYEFPFINDAGAEGAGNDPSKVLDKMLSGTPAYVQAKQGACWFCAGMTITAFDCLTLTAVLMFEVDTNPNGGVVLALLADGVFQMPPMAPPNVSLFYVELLIKVEINFTDGYIAADAALAPASHVYVPEARLTGQGSFYSWFHPNSHAGDWVLTIGGYHRAYQVPSHYPKPERLGLNFTVGDNIQVIGTGYVAVTPKCAMAGGTLHMSLSVGPVDAYCDVALDVFINFKPFYFVASISLSIGIGCEIDLLFVSFYLTTHIGADLTVWGPDSFGGIAHVDFWFFGFDIAFGSGRNTAAASSLADFYEMIRTAGPEGESRPTDGTSADNPFIAQHKYSIESGIFPKVPKASDDTQTQPASKALTTAPKQSTPPPPSFPDTGAATTWTVQANALQIRVDCDFALSSATLISSDPKSTITLPDLSNPLDPITSVPMRNTIKEPITSTLEVRIFSTEVEDDDNNKNSNSSNNPAKGDLQSGFQLELVFKKAPKAMWGEYDAHSDPLINSSAPQLQDGTSPTVDLCMGVRIRPPEPKLAACPVIHFDATAAMLGPIDDVLLPGRTEQTDFLSRAFVPKDKSTAWKEFGEMWSGSGTGEKTKKTKKTMTMLRATASAQQTQTTPTPTPTPLPVVISDNKVPKPNVKGSDDDDDDDDDDATNGMLDLCADVLGWNRRPPADKIGGLDIKGDDGRYEWQLKSQPPEILTERELGYYYFALPMVTA